jgi:Ca2+/Na+ antiporter
MSALGYGVMAVTGTVAGQLFNFLIGFGLNMAKGCWHGGGSVGFDLFGDLVEAKGRGEGENVILEEGRKRNDSSIYSMIILLVVVAHLGVLLFVPKMTGMVLDKKLNYYLYTVYVFTVFYVLVTFLYR